MSGDHVHAEATLGGQSGAAQRAHRLAAVPGEVLAAPRAVAEQLAAAGHRTVRGVTCRDSGDQHA